MQYKIGKPQCSIDVSPKPKTCKGYNNLPCSIVHIELVTSWPVTILWILLSWLVSTLATAAYVHPEWFVREHQINKDVLTYDRDGLTSTLGMVSVCYHGKDKGGYHDHIIERYHRQADQMEDHGTIVSGSNYRVQSERNVMNSNRKQVQEHGSNAAGDSFPMQREDVMNNNQDKGEVQKRIKSTAGGNFHVQNVMNLEHVDGKSSVKELECHNFEEDFPSGSWQASYVLFGSGCVLLTWCSILAFCNVWIVGRKNRQLVATLIGRIQLVAAVLQAASLLLYPLILGSSFAKFHCGPDCAAYTPGSCRIGWAYIAAIASTLLACYCPLLAHFSHYNIFSPCLWTEI